jgi:hypothetical protein
MHVLSDVRGVLLFSSARRQTTQGKEVVCMAMPYVRSLKRKPQAIVSLSYVYDEKANAIITANGPAAQEFEWFETDEGRENWFDACTAWNAEDVRDFGDLFHISFEITDTANLTVGRVKMAPLNVKAGPKDAKVALDASVLAPLKAVVKAIQNDVTTVLPKPEPRKASAKKAKVKGKAAKAAAAVVQKDGVRKGVRGVAKKPPVNRDARAAALKARLAGKQEKAAVEVAALDEALATAGV